MNEPEEFYFENISVNKGLSQNSVNCILQDKIGFMWFGTMNGLNRYDGSKIKIYNKFSDNSNYIPGVSICSSFKDHEGNLWFGTFNGGLLKYNVKNNTFTNYTLNFSGRYCKDKVIITAICEDQLGNLWLGTYRSGVLKFDKETGNNYRIEYDDSYGRHFIFSLLVDESGKVWIGTDGNGLDIFDPITKALENNFKHEKNDLYSISNDVITFIHLDKEENYWIGTRFGVNKFDSKEKKFERFYLDKDSDRINVNSISSICDDTLGNLWIGTLMHGLYKINKSNQFLNCKVIDTGYTNSNYIKSLFCDISGVIWIGTLDSGVSRLNTIRKKFYFVTGKGSENSKKEIRALKLFADKENLWIGTYFNGLLVMDLKSKKISEIELKKTSEDLNSYNVMSIHEDEEGNKWIGNAEGLFKIESKNGKIQNFKYNLDEENQNDIYSIIKLDSKNLLIGTRRFGILIFDIVKHKYEIYNEVLNNKLDYSSTIVHLLLDSSKCLWIKGLTQRGIYKYDISNDLLKEYNISVNAIHEDQNKNIWIGTSSGLGKYSAKEDIFNIYNIKENENVRFIQNDDEGKLWLALKNIIAVFDPITEKHKFHSVEDSNFNNEFELSFCKGLDGTIYFGGNKGVICFHPDEIKDNTNIPNIVVTNFLIYNKVIESSPTNCYLKNNIFYTNEIELSYKDGVFTFEFAALIYNNPSKNQNAYMMEGFDKDWVYCGNRRSATYTNLNPGHYTFRVKGSNEDGVWNEEGTSIKITITPPYWKTWWFKGLGLLGAVGATGLAYKNRLDKIEKEKNDQEEFSRKLIESQENERKRIASELHDTIAHDVLITQNKAAFGLKHSGEKEKVENILKEISQQASTTIKDVRNISYNLHPHLLEKVGFTKTIKSIVSEVNEVTGIDFDFESDIIDGHLTKESEINLFRVIQESINNMIKHSGADKAEVKLLVSEDYILVILKDNGKGISPIEKSDKTLSDPKGGFGLSGMKERIKYMKGEIHIESGENKGTSIIIRIPVKMGK